MLLTFPRNYEIIDYQQKLVNKITEGSIMTEINIGDTYKTRKSGTVGVVQEIVKNANGSLRVRLEVEGTDKPRWTTAFGEVVLSN